METNPQEEIGRNKGNNEEDMKTKAWNSNNLCTFYIIYWQHHPVEEIYFSVNATNVSSIKSCFALIAINIVPYLQKSHYYP